MPDDIAFLVRVKNLPGGLLLGDALTRAESARAAKLVSAKLLTAHKYTQAGSPHRTAYAYHPVRAHDDAPDFYTHLVGAAPELSQAPAPIERAILWVLVAREPGAKNPKTAKFGKKALRTGTLHLPMTDNESALMDAGGQTTFVVPSAVAKRGQFAAPPASVAPASDLPPALAAQVTERLRDTLQSPLGSLALTVAALGEPANADTPPPIAVLLTLAPLV